MNLLGLDFGTTSLKSAVYNKAGECLFTHETTYDLIHHDGFIEFNADEYLSMLLSSINAASDICSIYALAIDTQCETMILADDNGNPLCNAIVWLDNRGQKEALQIKNDFGTRLIYEKTGQCDISGIWPACKLLWIKNNLPEVWVKTRKIFLLEDWLLYKLTGRFVTQKTLQSSSLYFDIVNGCWWHQMLEYIGIKDDVLPKLMDSGEYVGDYKGIHVATSAMDQAAGAIGAGIYKEGMISEMTGTAMALFSPTDTMPAYHEGIKVPCHFNATTKYAVMPWISTAGMALKWFRDSFIKEANYSELDMLAKDIPAGSDGLMFFPHLCGSTHPIYDPEAKGCFYGLKLSHGKEHFSRAILESIAYMLNSSISSLKQDISMIHSIGGSARSDLWCQIKADVTKKQIKTLKESEPACKGSAILAGIATKEYLSIQEACEKTIYIDKIYQAKSDGYDSYTKLYNEYMKMNEKIYGKGGR
ncbi:MAG TPA: FGGY family carbohydrate kinase [Clostridia bacterium]|jgi:xylulokinase|nr:FGGY family carbohydrate kinase [Clostridia bacterium]HQM39612.1 FGGY family carbohydrate kinase [Clostridia bacterium]